jgi:hypothetical protein
MKVIVSNTNLGYFANCGMYAVLVDTTKVVFEIRFGSKTIVVEDHRIHLGWYDKPRYMSEQVDGPARAELVRESESRWKLVLKPVVEGDVPDGTIFLHTGAYSMENWFNQLSTRFESAKALQVLKGTMGPSEDEAWLIMTDSTHPVTIRYWITTRDEYGYPDYEEYVLEIGQKVNKEKIR